MSGNENGTDMKLVFTDDRTASIFNQMRDQLAEAFTTSDRIELELSNVRDVDRSLVELMCSAHRVAESLGKSFAFGSDDTGRTIRELACDSGYMNMPCKQRNSGCLYQEEADLSRKRDGR